MLRPGRHCCCVHPEPADVLPRLGRGERPLNPFHVRELDAARAGRSCWRAGFECQPAARAAPRAAAAAYERRHGSLVGAQLAGPSATWSAGSCAGVRPRRPADDFVVGAGRRRATPSTSSPWRCAGDGLSRAGRHLLPRAAHATCRGWRTRRVAGRRGVAAPGVGRRPTCRCSRCSTGWPPRAAATCSPSASPRCWPRSSTTRTACASSTPGSASGRPGPTGSPAAPAATCGRPASASSGRRGSALADFEDRWRHGASPVLRPLVDAGVVELLGGPATHPFLPLLDERVARFALRDRAGRRRAAARPAAGRDLGAGVRLRAGPGAACTRRRACERFLVDGPTLLGGRPPSTADAWTVGDTRRRRVRPRPRR